MHSKELKKVADDFLREITDKLELLPFSELKTWPEWPESPDFELDVPEVLDKYSFGIMKDTQSDQSVRIAVQRYRPYILGIGEMTADGFFAHSDGSKRRFSQKDIWEVT